MNTPIKTTYQGSSSERTTKERDDNYHAVIHRDGNWRIIVCNDRIQWIIQRGKKAGTERRWRGDSYVTDPPVGRQDGRVWRMHRPSAG